MLEYMPHRNHIKLSWLQLVQVLLVLHGNTDRLRRAYYLRTVALTHTVAKETRVFGLANFSLARRGSLDLETLGDAIVRDLPEDAGPDTLPFTVLRLALILMAGLAAMAGGLVLRRSAGNAGR